jgi:hypothetical protein
MTAEPLTASALMATGRSMAGLDMVDTDAIEPLEVLVDSVNAESDLHERGAGGMRNKLHRILANRLRMQRDFAAHPEIHDQVVSAPLIIVGMPRTGSTKTQKLLCSSGDFNWLPMWQTSYPSLRSGSPGESPQWRVDGGLAYERWLEEASPDMKYCHQFLAMEPEEDSWILEHSLVSPVFVGFSPVRRFLTWMVEQDIGVQFRHLRDTLKYLQWQGVADPAKRWVLKCPMYYGLEPAVLDTFPDATLIMTHRTPLSAIPSGARMLELFHKCFTDADPDITGYYRGAASGLRRHIRNRAADPSMRVIDVHYLDLISDVAAVAGRLYDFAGVELDDASLRRIVQWDADHPKDAHGRHIYSLEQYGFEPEQMESDFSDYLEFMEEKVAGR